MANPALFRKIDKAVYEYGLIQNGDKILVGASGGKDSTTLLEYFGWRKKQRREDFFVAAYHVTTEISPGFPDPLRRLIKEWNIPLIIEEIKVLERLKPGKKMNCWWCSTQRRTELNNYAMAEGFNKIALGHHLDDILETLFMNILKKSELSTMPPALKYRQYPVEVIRPLCMCTLEEIINHSEKSGFAMITCTCNYQDNSERKAARQRINKAFPGKEEKLCFFEALRNIRPEYLTYPENINPFLNIQTME